MLQSFAKCESALAGKELELDGTRCGVGVVVVVVVVVVVTRKKARRKQGREAGQRGQAKPTRGHGNGGRTGARPAAAGGGAKHSRTATDAEVSLKIRQ